jgi:hypothetical protein
VCYYSATAFLQELGMIPETLASMAVQFFLGKTMQNALLDLSNETVQTAVDRLRHLIRYKLGGRPELSQAEKRHDTALLKKALVEESKDDFFCRELEKLVNEIQEKTQNSQQPTIADSNVGAIASTVSGGQNVGSMSGGVIAERIENFRLSSNDH